MAEEEEATNQTEITVRMTVKVVTEGIKVATVTTVEEIIIVIMMMMIIKIMISEMITTSIRRITQSLMISIRSIKINRKERAIKMSSTIQMIKM